MFGHRRNDSGGAESTGSPRIIRCPRTKYAVTRDELPYRTDTLFQVLETTFGVPGARTVGTQIAKRFYEKLELAFHRHDAYTLVDYVEDAKNKPNQ